MKIPSNKLEPLVEFSDFLSSWSTLNHTAAFLDVDRITQAFEQKMKLYNDENGDNVFTLAIERRDTRITIESMKNLLDLEQDELSAYMENLPLEDIMD